MYKLVVDNIPEGTNSSRGVSISSLIKLETNEKPIAYASLYRDSTAKFVFFVTKNGIIKKVPIEEYSKVKRGNGIIALNLREGDSLAAVTFIENEQMLLVSENGMVIRFDTKTMPISSRIAQGVKGMALNEGDKVLTCLPIKHTTDNLAVFSVAGLGKQVPLSEFGLQGRGGKGMACYKEKIAGVALIENSDDILVVGDKTSIRISAADLPSQTRIALGNSVLKNNKKVVSISKI
jgi:DNA gyrase subunit A